MRSLAVLLPLLGLVAAEVYFKEEFSGRPTVCQS